MESKHPEITHGALRHYISQISSSFVGQSTNRIHEYFRERGEIEGTRHQDLLPIFAFYGVGGTNHALTIPLGAVWSLYLAASHILDAIQDETDTGSEAHSIMALALANLALADLDVNRHAYSDILNALGQVTAVGINAQETEVKTSREWSRQGYFRNVLGKSASIIATGTWLGGRLATSDSEKLRLLRDFGLALGMAMQLSDDCLDLEEDLANGTFTLPVLEGLALVEHPDHKSFSRLIEDKPLRAEQVQEIIQILERMGTIGAAKRMVRAYQIQAAAIFEVMPGLEPYFVEYVRPAT